MSVDAAVVSNGVVGFGVAQGNEKGEIILAASKGFSGNWDVDLAEIHAIFFEVQTALAGIQWQIHYLASMAKDGIVDQHLSAWLEDVPPKLAAIAVGDVNLFSL